VAAAVAGLAALVFGMWLGGDLIQVSINGLAIGGASTFTAWGLATSKMIMDLASVGVIGMLVASLLLPVRDRELGAPARRCLRSASWLALVWGVSNAALLLFSWADVVAAPVTSLPLRRLFTDTARTFPDATDFMSSTALALVISVAISITQTRWGALVLLPLSLYNLVPMTLQGHAGHGTILKYSLIVHVIALSLWVGGLAALLAHARSDPEDLAVAVPRFSTLALYCYFAVAATGVIASWELLQSFYAIWGSRYGVLLMFKVMALIALGVLGWWQRRRTVQRIRAADGPRSRRAFIRLAAAEVVVMVVAVGLAVALSRSASPDTINLHSGRVSSLAHVQPGIQRG
jgi:putative copper resistance protein D